MENRKYTIENFKVNRGKVIEESGYFSTYSQKYDINMSSILTKLIQEAGRWCEFYASDLFIDWEAVERGIKSSSEDRAEFSASYLFGFRQNGVDHDRYVFTRFNNEGYSANSTYRSLWRLDLTADGDEMKRPSAEFSKA